MVAEMLWKYRSKLRHRGRNSPILSIETKARWKIDHWLCTQEHNFPPKNLYCPPTWLVFPLLYILIKEFVYLICCFLVPHANYAYRIILCLYTSQTFKMAGIIDNWWIGCWLADDAMRLIWRSMYLYTYWCIIRCNKGPRKAYYLVGEQFKAGNWRFLSEWLITSAVNSGTVASMTCQLSGYRWDSGSGFRYLYNQTNFWLFMGKLWELEFIMIAQTRQ